MKKKSPSKLVVQRETLRALAHADLPRIVGGDPALAFGSNPEVCTTLLALKPSATC